MCFWGIHLSLFSLSAFRHHEWQLYSIIPLCAFPTMMLCLFVGSYHNGTNWLCAEPSKTMSPNKSYLLKLFSCFLSWWWKVTKASPLIKNKQTNKQPNKNKKQKQKSLNLVISHQARLAKAQTPTGLSPLELSLFIYKGCHKLSPSSVTLST